MGVCRQKQVTVGLPPAREVSISRPLGPRSSRSSLLTVGVCRQKQVTVGLRPAREVIISRPLGAQELKKLVTNYGCI
jgi:hypothetical protein